jgi:hypothetical protein
MRREAEEDQTCLRLKDLVVVVANNTSHYDVVENMIHLLFGQQSKNQYSNISLRRCRKYDSSITWFAQGTIS